MAPTLRAVIEDVSSDDTVLISYDDDEQRVFLTVVARNAIIFVPGDLVVYDAGRHPNHLIPSGSDMPGNFKAACSAHAKLIQPNHPLPDNVDDPKLVRFIDIHIGIDDKRKRSVTSCRTPYILASGDICAIKQRGLWGDEHASDRDLFNRRMDEVADRTMCHEDGSSMFPSHFKENLPGFHYHMLYNARVARMDDAKQLADEYKTMLIKTARDTVNWLERPDRPALIGVIRLKYMADSSVHLHMPDFSHALFEWVRTMTLDCCKEETREAMEDYADCAMSLVLSEHLDHHKIAMPFPDLERYSRMHLEKVMQLSRDPAAAAPTKRARDEAESVP